MTNIKKKKIIAVILAGGTGSRLWPLSRKDYPKQFLSLVGKNSLLQETLIRTQKTLNPSDIFILTNKAYYSLCLEQLEAIGIKNAHYILEPCASSTAPAIALSSLYILEHFAKDTLMLVLPSDHLITKEEKLISSIEMGLKNFNKESLVIFGVTPTSPNTGYGYIQAKKAKTEELYQVERFVEKPDLSKAKKYLKEGNYYWNSGMFLLHPKCYLDELKTFAPNSHEKVKIAYDHSSYKEQVLHVDEKTFKKCPRESIDCAVMEKTSKARMIPLNASWSDLGCWMSIAQVGLSNQDNNIIHGNVIAKHSNNCLIRSDGRLISTIGVQDQIVISTADAVLVADKKYSQEVKKVVEELQSKGSTAVLHHTTVVTSWGHEQILEKTPHYCVKRLVLKKGKNYFSKPQKGIAHWFVVQGQVQINAKSQARIIQENQFIHLDKQKTYEVVNAYDQECHIIETKKVL